MIGGERKRWWAVWRRKKVVVGDLEDRERGGRHFGGERKWWWVVWRREEEVVGSLQERGKGGVWWLCWWCCGEAGC